jgi:hypothetical protein
MVVNKVATAARAAEDTAGVAMAGKVDRMQSKPSVPC